MDDAIRKHTALQGRMDPEVDITLYDFLNAYEIVYVYATKEK